MNLFVLQIMVFLKRNNKSQSGFHLFLILSLDYALICFWGYGFV